MTGDEMAMLIDRGQPALPERFALRALEHVESRPSRCHANDQFIRRIACSRLLVQCGAARIRTLFEPGFQQRAATARIVVTRQMPRLRERHAAARDGSAPTDI